MSTSIFQIKDKIFYGWVIVASLIASTFIMRGVNSSFGVFFKSFKDTFGLTRATTSTIFSSRTAFSMSFVTTHIVPHAIDLGFSTIESSTILSLSGITMIAGRLIAGVIADKLSAKVVAITCSLLQITALLSLVWIQDLWMLYLFGLVHGLAIGGFGSTQAATS